MSDTGKKRVLVSCGTKFHSDYMAAQLEKHGLLNKVVTSHPSWRFLTRVKLPRQKIKFLPPMFTLIHLLEKLQPGGRPGQFFNYKLPLLYDRLASKYVKGANISITWAWAGLSTIRRMKANGGIAIIEECGSCNLHQNKILEEEYRSLGLNFTNRTPEFITKRELDEIALADYVLCPSNYVAGSFEGLGVPPEKFVIIPYGANLSLFRPEPRKKEAFTVLFVGTIGVRKGLIYLFRALELFKKKYSCKCILIGRLEEQFSPVYQRYAHLFEHIPKVDHQQISKYYNLASVFVFPSLDEGMAYVQLEAMACGLPVICTFNSGGDSIINDGEEGFLVPVRNERAIADKLEYLYENPAERDRMAARAAQSAQSFSWDRYGDRLSNFIRSL